MKDINIPALILAVIVVAMFCLVGVMVAYGNFLWMGIFFISGIALMGFGIYLKVKNRQAED